ncbi:pilin [Candidatus Saccharibacteria bacterium]|nr:pilin [Candidatus Saccharibacteria bacterium]
MIKKLKLLMLTFSSLFMLAAPVAVTTSVSALDITGHVCKGTEGKVTGASPKCTAGLSTFDAYVTFALNLLSIIVGIAAVFMIIFAGLRYITSGGKEEGVKNAKNTILYAVIGLVVVALAQIIVHFVLTEANPSTIETP